MKKGSLFCALSLIAVACAMPAMAVPVEFYDANGNLLVGCDVVAITDDGGQKFSGPAATDGVYDVNVDLGEKVKFQVSDRTTVYDPREVIIGDLNQTLQVLLSTQGANETCEAAAPINIGDTVAGDNTGNTGTTSETFCGTSITAPGIGDWYEFTVPEGGGDRLLEASTCNQASYDTKLSIFCRDCADSVCVTGNDDGPGCAAFSSLVQFCAEEGATYQIFVHGFLGATGAYNLSLTDLGTCTATTECIPPPPPTPTGACCSDNCDIVGGAVEALFNECLEVDCTIATEVDCLNAGGAYAGDGTECTTLSGTVESYSFVGSAAIPDNNPAGVRTEVVVPDDGSGSLIGDLDVDLVINHTWIGDLSVILTHKDTGTEVQLWNRNCGSSNALLITSDDEGTQTFCGAPGTPTTGGIPPALANGFTSFLSDFDGESLAGTWSLFVDDNFSADTGTVDGWTLLFSPGTPTCTADCAPGTGGPGPGPGDDEDEDNSSDGIDDNTLTSTGRTDANSGDFDGLLEFGLGTDGVDSGNTTSDVRGGRIDRKGGSR